MVLWADIGLWLSGALNRPIMKCGWAGCYCMQSAHVRQRSSDKRERILWLARSAFPEARRA